MFPPWTSAEVQLLAACIDEGLTGSQAARRIKRPRAGVIAKAWRLHWHFGSARTSQEVPVRLPRQPAPPCQRKVKSGHPLSVTFDDETYAQIVALSRPHVSRAQIVRELVEWGLEAVEEAA